MLILPERPDDGPAIDRLLDRAFGPDRHTKTVYRLRAGIDPVPDLCFVGLVEGALRGTLRFWPVRAGGAPALLLGPIAVGAEDRGRGHAKALMWHGLARARDLGHGLVLLVGDLPYYGQFGFSRGPAEPFGLPGPVELDRFLGLELIPGYGAGLAGPIEPAPPHPSIRRAVG